MAEITKGNIGFGSGQLLQLFRDGQPHTRADLAEITGLARSTISLRLDPLVKIGLVAPATDATSTGGRPSARLILNESSFVVAGVDFGATHAVAALADLGGKILVSIETKRQISDGPEVCLRWMIEEINHLLNIKLLISDVRNQREVSSQAPRTIWRILPHLSPTKSFTRGQKESPQPLCLQGPFWVRPRTHLHYHSRRLSTLCPTTAGASWYPSWASRA